MQESSSQIQAIKTVIIDDEIQGIKKLKKLLEQHCPQIKIVACFQDSLLALKRIPKLQPDLLLLDIRMPQLNGLELHELLGFDQYNVIYTTALDSSSDIIKALRFNAIGKYKKSIPKSKKRKSFGIDITKKRATLLHPENKLKMIDLMSPEGQALGTSVVLRLYDPE